MIENHYGKVYLRSLRVDLRAAAAAAAGGRVLLRLFEIFLASNGFL